MLYRAEERFVIIKAFEKILYYLNKITEAVEKANLPFVIQKANRFVRDKNLLFYALHHMSSEKDLSMVETYARPGAVACTAKTLILIEKLNLSKDEFKAVVRDYTQCHGLWHPAEVREILLKAGYGVVRLKEVFRHLVAVDYHPKYMSWCKGKRYSSKQITHVEAREKLLNLGEGKAITLQLNKLSALRKKEHFVVRKEIPPCWFANIKAFGVKGKGSIRCYRSSLPIFYLLDKYLAEPAVIFSKQKSSVPERSDKLTTDKPFLPSIHAYRSHV